MECFDKLIILCVTDPGCCLSSLKVFWVENYCC